MKRFCLLLITGILLIHFQLAAQQNKKAKPQQLFTLQQADALFSAAAWKDAIPVYEAILKTAQKNSMAWNKLGFCYHNLGDYDKAIASYNNSLQFKTAPQIKPIVHSRLARAYALKNEQDKAFAFLDSAVNTGYKNVTELESHKDFNALRTDTRFKSIVTRANNSAMPCLTQPQMREFDFWLGEWEVYPNGTNVLVGTSKIEMASGGCMILENWTAIGGVPHNGKSMNYVNPQAGKWEQLWIGSGGINQNNPQKFINGVYKDSAMRFDFEQVSAQGKQTGRFIFFNEGPNQVRQFNEVSSDGGKTWTTVYDFVYKRKK
jgi:tetratricopeptide (TPR) repeat protein